MAPVLLALAGFVLILLVQLDALASTIRTDEGRLTRLVQQLVCMGFSGLYRLTGRRVFLNWSGVMVIVSMVATWVLLLWAGWLLVFASTPGAVINAETGKPARFWELVYFSGYASTSRGMLSPLWEPVTTRPTGHFGWCLWRSRP